MDRKRLPGASYVALRYCGYDSGLDPWMDFNYELLKYLNDIKHHKQRKLNGQPPTFINHWTACVMRLTPRDHSLLGNNEPSRQYIHLSRAKMVHNERTPVCNSHDPSPSLLYSHLPRRSSKICNWVFGSCCLAYTFLHLHPTTVIHSKETMGVWQEQRQVIQAKISA